MGVSKAHLPEPDPRDRGSGDSPFVVEYVPEHRVVIARFRGQFDSGSAWKGLDAIKGAVGSGAVEGVLLDVRAADYTPSIDEVSAFANEYVAFLGRRRLAVITRLLIHYGLARMLVQQAQASGVDAQVFLDERDTRDWLHSPDPR
jgi:hypothetical protein